MFFAPVLSLALIMSCSRKDEKVEAPVLEHAFSINAELPVLQQSDDAVKGSLASFISATWNNGDKVSVVNLSEGKILGGQLTTNDSGTNARFSGNISGTIGNGDVLALFYPAFTNTSEEDFGTARKIDISSQNASDENVALYTYGLFTGTGSGTITNQTVSFTYSVSYLKLNMANLPAGSAISKISLKNIPSMFTVLINDSKTDFVIATDVEKAAKGVIDITGPVTVSQAGTIAVRAGVMPSDAASDRCILVTVDGDGDYASPLTGAALLSHKYYNTIASGFDKINIAGKNSFGVYDMVNGTVVDEYAEFTSTLISGTESGESDFSIVNTSTNTYWTLKGIPSEAASGSTFSARLFQYGVSDFPEGTIDGAKVKLMESDGDFSKMWIKAGDYVFIVRK